MVRMTKTLTISKAAATAEVTTKAIFNAIKADKFKSKKVANPVSGTGYVIEIDKASFEKWNEGRRK